LNHKIHNYSFQSLCLQSKHCLQNAGSKRNQPHSSPCDRLQPSQMSGDRRFATVEILKILVFSEINENRRAGEGKPTRPPMGTHDRQMAPDGDHRPRQRHGGRPAQPAPPLRGYATRAARPPRLPEHRGWHRGTERAAAAACCASRRTGGRPDRRAREAGDRAPHRREESVNLRHARQAQKVKKCIDNITG